MKLAASIAIAWFTSAQLPEILDCFRGCTSIQANFNAPRWRTIDRHIEIDGIGDRSILLSKEPLHKTTNMQLCGALLLLVLRQARREVWRERRSACGKQQHDGYDAFRHGQRIELLVLFVGCEKEVKEDSRLSVVLTSHQQKIPPERS